MSNGPIESAVLYKISTYAKMLLCKAISSGMTHQAVHSMTLCKNRSLPVLVMDHSEQAGEKNDVSIPVKLIDLDSNWLV